MAAGDATPTTTTSSSGTATGSTPSTWDCLMHPIDCASGTLGATSGAVGGTTQGATTAGGQVLQAATAPLHELSNTAMWTAIGIAAIVVAVLAVSFVAVYAFHRI